MANKNTKAAKKAASKAAKTGKATITDFALKAKNPANRRKSPWRGAKSSNKRTATYDLAAA